MHGVPAMDLHRDLTDSSVSRDLLVQLSRDHHLYDSALPRSQRLESPSETCQLAFVIVLSPSFLDRSLNRVQESQMIDRFGEKFHRTGLDGLYRHADISMAGNEDGRKLNVVFDQPLMQIQAAYVG